MLNDIFAVQISEGGLHCLLKRLASKGVDAYEMIRQRNGCESQREKTLVLDMAKRDRATCIAASDHRGTTKISENMRGISKDAVLVHDCQKAHFQTPVGSHQLYTAHLERETKYPEERYKVDWPVRFRSMLKKAHELKKQLTPPLYYYPNQLRTDLENELECLLQKL